MFHKLKRWLCERFLPIYCREEMLKEVKRLQAKIERLEMENGQLRAYIDGMDAAIRRRQRIIINTMEVGKHGSAVSHAEQQENS